MNRLTDKMRLGNDALSHQAKAGVVPIPKTGTRKKAKSVRTESIRGAKRVEQNSRPSRETRGG